MSQAISHPEKKAGGELATAKFCDDWYMKAYDLSGAGTASGIWLRQWRWKKIAVAGALGVCLGLGAAAWRPADISSVQEPSKTAPLHAKSSPLSEDIRSAVPFAGPSSPATPPIASREPVATPLTSEANGEEVERLKTRNRRLEALVKVLRQRPVDKRTVQEPASYLGQ